MGLFDECNLLEFTHPDFSGERLVACRNRPLAQLRATKWSPPVASHCRRAGQGVRDGRERNARRLTSWACVGRVVNKYKAAKHFELAIEHARFSYRIDQDQVAQEAGIDGIYVLRPLLGAEMLETPMSCAATSP
jgi:hypothetical protein